MNNNPFDKTIKAPLWAITLLLLIPVIGIFAYQANMSNTENAVVIERTPIKQEIVIEDKTEDRAAIEPKKTVSKENIEEPISELDKRQESVEEKCIENWVCKDWGECSEKYDSERGCEDLNRCGTYKEQPELIKVGCYREPKLGFDIEIRGDAACKEDKKKALDLLKEKAPEYYTMVKKYVGIIECKDVTNDGTSYAYPMETIPRISLGYSSSSSPTSQYSLKQVAGTIVHEAWHNKTYFYYLTENKPKFNVVPDCKRGGLENELEAARQELAAMDKMEAYPHESAFLIDRIKNPPKIWVEWGGCYGMTYEEYIKNPR